MLIFKVDQPPPTRQELDAEKRSLIQQKQQLVKMSLISDLLHCLILLAIYYFGLLSGYGLLVAIGIGTCLAICLATGLKEKLQAATTLILLPSVLIAIVLVFAVLRWWMAEPLNGSLLASLSAGSIVSFGAIVGRKVMKVYLALDRLRPLAEDEAAEKEMRTLCQQHSELDNYRQEALQILRPNLTFGELEAMRDWLKR